MQEIKAKLPGRIKFLIAAFKIERHERREKEDRERSQDTHFRIDNDVITTKIVIKFLRLHNKVWKNVLNNNFHISYQFISHNGRLLNV